MLHFKGLKRVDYEEVHKIVLIEVKVKSDQAHLYCDLQSILF